MKLVPLSAVSSPNFKSYRFDSNVSFNEHQRSIVKEIMSKLDETDPRDSRQRSYMKAAEKMDYDIFFSRGDSPESVSVDLSRSMFYAGKIGKDEFRRTIGDYKKGEFDIRDFSEVLDSEIKIDKDEIIDKTFFLIAFVAAILALGAIAKYPPRSENVGVAKEQVVEKFDSLGKDTLNVIKY